MISDNKSDTDIISQALSEASRYIDSSDPKQSRLLSEIKSNPNSKKSISKLIKLLLRILTTLTKAPFENIDFAQCDFQNNNKKSSKQQIDSNPLIQRLLTHLESHVVLLEALSHNPELASLFLVGSNGSQSFNSLQKSVLIEQASRLRFFLSNFSFKNYCDSLSDYQKNFSDIENRNKYQILNSLPQKLNEIEEIKNSTNESNDLFVVKSSFNEVCSLLETSVLFNNILLQKNNHSDVFKKNEKLEKQILEIKNKKDSIQTQLERLKKHLKKDKDSSKYIKKISQLENDKKILMNQIEINRNSPKNENDSLEIKTVKTENNQLSSQIDLLNKQITNYQLMISQKDGKIDSLYKKINDLSMKSDKDQQINSKQRSEVEELQKLYKNVSNQLAQMTDQSNVNHNKIQKLQKVNQKLSNENQELKQLLETANETNQQQMKENAVLIKQMRKNDDPRFNSSNQINDLKSKIKKLKKKLNDAFHFISQLQSEIEEYKSTNIRERKRKTEYVLMSSSDNSDDDSYKKLSDDDNSFSLTFKKGTNKNQKNTDKFKNYDDTNDENCNNKNDNIEEEKADVIKSNISNSIMPSFDELERDIKNLEISVKKTRTVVAKNIC